MAPMLGMLGDDSSHSKDEDDGGGDGSLPSEAEVGSLDHCALMAPVIGQSKDEGLRRESPSV